VSSVALCTFAIASQADPINLQAVCHLSNIAVGKGSCHLSYILSDDFQTPGNARKSQIRIDNILVAQYVNDITNPASFSIPTVSGSAEVQCGVNHTVTAQIAALGVGTTYVRVGALPAVLCPTAP
jgi:hypothetical protein